MTWFVIIAVGLGSYAMRVLPVLLDGRFLSSPKFERVISHAGSAALAALIATGFRRAAVSTGDVAATLSTAVAALTVAVLGGSMQRVLLVATAVYAATRLAVWLV